MAVEDVLGISKTGFFALLREYHQDSDRRMLVYQRSSPKRLSALTEVEIEKELMLDKGLIDDSTLPITTYSYAAIRDRLSKRGITVALSTIIDRTKDLDIMASIICLLLS